MALSTSGRLGVGQNDVSLGLEHTEERVGPDDGFEFGLFGRGQLTFRALFGELFVASLRLGVRLNADQGTREFDGQVLRERSEEPLQRCGRAICHDRNVAR